MGLKKILNQTCVIEWLVDSELKEKNNQEIEHQEKDLPLKRTQNQSTPKPAQKTVQLNPRYLFENFIHGPLCRCQSTA